MAEPKNFVFYSNWKDFVQGLGSDVDQFQLLTAIMEYGVTGEYHMENVNPIVKTVFETMIKPQIDRSQRNYAESIEYGKTHGRPKTVNDNMVKELALTGMKAKEIAKQLGISIDSVYSSKGWKERKG